MTKVLRGIVHGKTIEVNEDLGMWEGQTVELIVIPSNSVEPTSEKTLSRTPCNNLPGPPARWRPGSTESAAGMMASCWTIEDDQILEEIHRERKTETRREIVE